MRNVNNVVKYILGAVVSSLIGLAVDTVTKFLPNVGGIVDTFVIIALALLCGVIFIRLYEEKAEHKSNMASKEKLYEEKIEALKVADEKLSNSEIVTEEFGVNIGDAYLLMSLTQNLNEPLKIKYLEKSATEYKNELACLILANLYSSGIEKDDVKVIEQNREKAAELYHYMADVDETSDGFDDHGVANWQLGCYYENNLIKEAQMLPDDDSRHQRAANYYKVSAEKGFGKAFNNLAIYCRKGLGGLKKDLDLAEEHYITACKYGDVYALVNRGHLRLEQYKSSNNHDIGLLDKAEESFRTAAEFDNNEAYYQLGQVYSIRADGETDVNKKYDYIKAAAHNYVQAFSKVNNVYSASAYYQLGKLINASTKLQGISSNLTKEKEVSEALKNAKFEDLAAECLIRAYEQFEKIGKSRLGYKYGLVYEELKDSLSKCL